MKIKIQIIFVQNVNINYKKIKIGDIIQRLKKKSEKSYTWDEVVKITTNAEKSSCEPFGNYSNNEFVLEEVPISKIPNSDYLTLDECKEYDMDEDLGINTIKAFVLKK